MPSAQWERLRVALAPPQHDVRHMSKLLKLILVGVLTTGIPLFGFLFFSLVFSLGSGHDSSFVVISALVNLMYAAAISMFIRRYSASPIYFNYLLGVWVFVAICFLNLFGVSPIKAAWLSSLFIILFGFALSLLAHKNMQKQIHA